MVLGTVVSHELDVAGPSPLVFHHISQHGHFPSAFMLPGLPTKGLPKSTTEALPGECPTPAQPQPPLAPPPNHPLWMEPPAVRAGIYANIAKRKWAEAQEHAEIAQKEAEKADQEWKKSLSYATEAAARRDACMKYQLHASMVRSLNRLVGFGTRSTIMVEDEGNGPFGGEAPEEAIVDNMVLETSRLEKQAKLDVSTFQQVLDQLEEVKTKGFQELFQRATGYMKRLEQQHRRLSEIRDHCLEVQHTIKEQMPESHEPPYLPKRLLRPDGNPWWPDKPPKPETGMNRLMLVKGFRPGGIGRFL